MNHIKQRLMKMTQGIKTLDSIGTELPTSSLETLPHSFLLSHLNISAHFIQLVRKPMMSSLKKQLNSGLKKCFSAQIAYLCVAREKRNRCSRLNSELINFHFLTQKKYNAREKCIQYDSAFSKCRICHQ